MCEAGAAFRRRPPGASAAAAAAPRSGRAAEELELERATHHRQAVQRAREHHQRIALAGRLLRLGEAVAVALAVAELERILRGDGGADLGRRTGIEEALEALARADAHVVTALGADIEVALELGAIEHRIAGRALDPQSLRDRARAPLGLDTGGHDLVEPGHS